MAKFQIVASVHHQRVKFYTNDDIVMVKSQPRSVLEFVQWAWKNKAITFSTPNSYIARSKLFSAGPVLTGTVENTTTLGPGSNATGRNLVESTPTEMVEVVSIPYPGAAPANHGSAGLVLMGTVRASAVEGELKRDTLQTRDDLELTAHGELEEISIHPS